MATYSDIPPEKMASLLRYDPDTGKLHWEPRGDSAFDAKYAGREAFTAIHSGGYKAGKIFGVPVKAHRAIWAVVHGEWPDGEIDHINHDKSDNRLSNLRLVTRAENAKNLSLRGDSKTGRVGVRLVKGRYWVAAGRHFKTFRAACEARAKFEADNAYHPNHGKAA